MEGHTSARRPVEAQRLVRFGAGQHHHIVALAHAEAGGLARRRRQRPQLALGPLQPEVAGGGLPEHGQAPAEPVALGGGILLEETATHEGPHDPVGGAHVEAGAPGDVDQGQRSLGVLEHGQHGDGALHRLCSGAGLGPVVARHRPHDVVAAGRRHSRAPPSRATRQTSLAHAEEIDHEHERLVRPDHTPGAAAAVAEVGRDGDLAATADLHPGDTLVPPAMTWPAPSLKSNVPARSHEASNCLPVDHDTPT